jgi:hypothetical protein
VAPRALPDTDANLRDLHAEVRDRKAEVRDHNAQHRDDRISNQPDPEGGRRRAAHDREAAARDRVAADDDRQLARGDREASTWDRSMAQQMAARLQQALNKADDLAEATLLIGQAEGMLMTALDVSVTEALIELGDRAAREQVGLQEAARRIIAERRASGPMTILEPGAG